MSIKLRLYLGRKVIDCLHKSTKFSANQLQPLITIGNKSPSDNVELNLPLGILETQLGITNVNEILRIQPDDIIKNIAIKNNKAGREIAFEIDKSIFMKDVVEHCASPDLTFTHKNIVVEYSSPNIAKPFHLGHLRSTIIGNFISNLNMFLKNNVTRLNYLGDWGTQFGFIKVGVDELKITETQMKLHPLKSLYDSYVHANKLAETDKEIIERAKNEFLKLESGSVSDLENWQQYMTYTKNELHETYKRLGVTFDEYNYESMYGIKHIAPVLSLLREKRILEKDKDGKEVAQLNNRRVTVVKSDGTTLYLTRDIAAAIDRHNKYNFDKMYYVVENGQSDHFNALKGILHRMDIPWADRIMHVKFGRIHGLSTRKGTAVFLKDILDESKEIMVQRQIQSPNTKVPITDELVSDILGVSCVIINDLKTRRQKDYSFDWSRVLEVKGDTGIKLQYTHCRLCSLEKNCGAIAAPECIPEILKEQEILDLLKELAKFHAVLYAAKEQLEASILVVYLFHLCNLISKTLKTVQVKGMSEEVASQRLLIFNTARKVLHNGMVILGLQPLREM